MQNGVSSPRFIREDCQFIQVFPIFGSFSAVILEWPSCAMECRHIDTCGRLYKGCGTAGLPPLWLIHAKYPPFPVYSLRYGNRPFNKLIYIALLKCSMSPFKGGTTSCILYCVLQSTSRSVL